MLSRVWQLYHQLSQKIYFHKTILRKVNFEQWFTLLWNWIWIHYDTQSETHESKNYSFQIQDRPHRALYYILPSLIAAVIFNIPRYSEPMIFQHAHSCWRFDMCCFLSEICLIRFQIRSTLLCNTNFQSQISTIFSTMITFRFFDTELKIKCLDFEACNCGKMVRCVGRVENIFFTHRLNSYCYQPLFLMF